MSLTKADKQYIDRTIDEKLAKFKFELDERFKNVPDKNELYSKLDAIMHELQTKGLEMELIPAKISEHEQRFVVIENHLNL